MDQIAYEKSVAKLADSVSTAKLLGVLRMMASNADALWSTDTAVFALSAVRLIERLLAGYFTEEEIHNFCHKLEATVSARDFASGCMAYQTQLYGSSPVMELLCDTDKLLGNWGISPHDNTPASDLRRKIKEQTL